MNLSLFPFVSLQPEVLFITKGGGTSLCGDSYSYSYLEYPILVKFKLPLGPFGIHALGGVHLGLLTGATRTRH